MLQWSRIPETRHKSLIVVETKENMIVVLEGDTWSLSEFGGKVFEMCVWKIDGHGDGQVTGRVEVLLRR